MPRAAPLLSCLAVVGACTLTEDRFVETFAADYCARVKACDETVFWTTWYDGTPECTADVQDTVGDKAYGNGSVACAWDAEASQTCLDALDADDCDDVLGARYVDACADPAWDCITITN